MELRLNVRKTPEFNEWYKTLGDKERTRIDARLDNMAFGHFGNSRRLGDSLFELKWKNGMRVYYSRMKIGDVDVITLWGGFKGSQKADIAKARRLKEKYEDALKNRE